MRALAVLTIFEDGQSSYCTKDRIFPSPIVHDIVIRILLIPRDIAHVHGDLLGRLQCREHIVRWEPLSRGLHTI